MADYVKHVDGKYVLFLIPIKEDDGKIIYLDFSKAALSAIRLDSKNEHDSEKGPEFGIELHRATEYVEYLRKCKLNVYNFHRYETKGGYSLFIENV